MNTPRMLRKVFLYVWCATLFLFSTSAIFAATKDESEQRKQEDFKKLQDQFKWWPTDAKPEPVKDTDKGGYWWWPTSPGQAKPWGNRGYIYVYKIIFDYKSEELPAPKPQELRPSLLIKRILKNVKIYFDLDKAGLRSDALPALKAAVKALNKNPETNILITGNCDLRGTERYNEKLGRRRAEAIKTFMTENGISEERVRIVSRGKLDAVAPLSDLEGMQKERNAQFMVAEVEEVMIPYEGAPTTAEKVEEGKYVTEEKENVETSVRVSTQEYVIKKGDTLSGIAQREYGKAYRWKYLYEINKDKIKNPNKLKPGIVISIPVE